MEHAFQCPAPPPRYHFAKIPLNTWGKLSWTSTLIGENEIRLLRLYASHRGDNHSRLEGDIITCAMLGDDESMLGSCPVRGSGRETSTLDTVNNLVALYADQGKMEEAENMFQRALQGFEKAWGPDHTSTLNTVNNLGALYWKQGKMAEAEMMFPARPARKEEPCCYCVSRAYRTHLGVPVDENHATSWYMKIRALFLPLSGFLCEQIEYDKTDGNSDTLAKQCNQ